jgi:hypothetical protein
MRKKMVPATIRKIIPTPDKHPVLACTGWYWYRPGLPAQSPADILVFKEVLSTIAGERLRVFEWGSGASTIYYSKVLKSLGRKFEWHSMDNSRKWCQRVHQKVLRAHLSDRVRVYCSEFPAFWELPGYSPDNPVPVHSYTSSAEC